LFLWVFFLLKIAPTPPPPPPLLSMHLCQKVNVMLVSFLDYARRATSLSVFSASCVAEVIFSRFYIIYCLYSSSLKCQRCSLESRKQ
jgi:hypothetical protein